MTSGSPPKARNTANNASHARSRTAEIVLTITSGAGRTSPTTTTSGGCPEARRDVADHAVGELVVRQGGTCQRHASEHDHDRADEQPGGGGRGAAVAGMLEQAHHRRAAGGDGHRQGEVRVEPARKTASSSPGNTATEHVEVVPPHAHPDRETDHARRHRQQIPMLSVADAADDAHDDLAEHDDREQAHPLDERCGHAFAKALRVIGDHQGEATDHPTDDDQCPQHHLQRVRGEGARHHHHHAGDHPGDPARRRGPVAGVVVDALHDEPLPREQREQHGVCDRERLPVAARRLAGEDGEQREQAHLQEDVVPAAAVLPSVQLVPQRPVEPGQPDQPEHHRELGNAPAVDVHGEVVRRTPDQHDVDQVVEQLQEADLPLVPHLTMPAWRCTEPDRQPVADPSANEPRDLQALTPHHLGRADPRAARARQPTTPGRGWSGLVRRPGVDGQGHAGDPPRLIRHQPHHCVGHVLRLEHRDGQHVRRRSLAPAGGRRPSGVRLLAHERLDTGGVDGVDPDGVRRRTRSPAPASTPRRRAWTPRSATTGPGRAARPPSW